MIVIIKNVTYVCFSKIEITDMSPTDGGIGENGALKTS